MLMATVTVLGTPGLTMPVMSPSNGRWPPLWVVISIPFTHCKEGEEGKEEEEGKRRRRREERERGGGRKEEEEEGRKRRRRRKRRRKRVGGEERGKKRTRKERKEVVLGLACNLSKNSLHYLPHSLSPSPFSSP